MLGRDEAVTEGVEDSSSDSAPQYEKTTAEVEGASVPSPEIKDV